MCEYCKGWKDDDKLYGEHVYCDIYIGKVLNKPSLIVKHIRKGCPQNAECYAKDKAPKVAFIINYCPNCGEKFIKE